MSAIHSKLRGTQLPADLLAQHRKGSIVEYDAFTSTGNENSFAGPHQLHIQGKHGKDISFLAPHAEEKEVLFLPNTNFRVLGRRKQDLFTLIDLEEVER